MSGGGGSSFSCSALLTRSPHKLLHSPSWYDRRRRLSPSSLPGTGGDGVMLMMSKGNFNDEHPPEIEALTRGGIDPRFCHSRAFQTLGSNCEGGSIIESRWSR